MDYFHAQFYVSCLIAAFLGLIFVALLVINDNIKRNDSKRDQEFKGGSLNFFGNPAYKL